MTKEMGERILMLLKQRGNTQKQLAELTGVTETTMSRYITGEREPKAETLADIATALHTSTDYLLGRSDDADVENAYVLLARNASALTAEQKTALVQALFASDSMTSEKEDWLLSVAYNTAEPDATVIPCKLPSWRYEEIKRTVSNVIAYLKIDQFPIMPAAIAQDFGMELRPYSMLPMKYRVHALATSQDGFSAINPDGWRIICYNDEMVEEREKFTIMHEVWHMLLGHTEPGRLAEQEANFAAAYTLAPPPAVWACHPLPGPVGIEILCGISSSAAECAWTRYQSWLGFHGTGRPLEPYEVALANSFGARQLAELEWEGIQTWRHNAIWDTRPWRDEVNIEKDFGASVWQPMHRTPDTVKPVICAITDFAMFRGQSSNFSL